MSWGVPAICLPISVAGRGPYGFITYAGVVDASQTMLLGEILAIVQDVTFMQRLNRWNRHRRHRPACALRASAGRSIS